MDQSGNLHIKKLRKHAVVHVLIKIGFDFFSNPRIFFGLQLDPAGWLPRFFVNRLNTKLVMIIENLQKQAQACSINVNT